MKKTISILIIILVSYSCNKAKKETKIAVANWLIGKWENNSNQGNLSETWEKINDSLFTGTAYFIKENDTLHFEKIELKEKLDEIFYISTIIGQNNNKPITFKLSSENQKQLVFENKKNDYPQKITYNQITKDSVVVAISGKQQGKMSTENYSMKKK